MTARTFLFALGAAAFAFPAAAAITVIGNSAARLCYDAAESPLRSGAGIDHCDQALEVENLNRHDTVATHVNRGILRLRRGRIDEAIVDFDAAIALDPGQAEAYLNKGLALLRLPEGPDQALPLFDSAIQHKTRKPALAYYGRAVAHELGGRIRDAYRDYRHASRLDPDWRDPKTQLARFTVR